MPNCTRAQVDLKKTLTKSQQIHELVPKFNQAIFQITTSKIKRIPFRCKLA